MNNSKCITGKPCLSLHN